MFHDICSYDSAGPCQPNPCRNGGTCTAQDTTNYTCSCAVGFTGENCSLDLNFCIPNTCLNGGTCIEGFGTVYTCSCATGFTGTNCNSDLNFCTPTTCDNGGTCVEEYGTETSCICTMDFTGAKCTTCISGKFLFTLYTCSLNIPYYMSLCAISRVIARVGMVFSRAKLSENAAHQGCGWGRGLGGGGG